MTDFNQLPVDVLAFGAHPDDLELSMGGTLLRLKSLGYKVGLVDMTRGERGSRGTGETRKAEAAHALEILGLDFRENLDLGDQQVRDTPEGRRAVVECIRRHKPKIIFTHYLQDRHPDHEGTGILVKHGMFLANAANFEGNGEPHAPKTLLYFPSHWVEQPNVYVDVTEFFEQKLEAARAYTTQFYDPNSAGFATRLARPEFWDDLTARFRNFGTQIGVKYAEAFFVREKLRVDDPVAMFGR